MGAGKLGAQSKKYMLTLATLSTLGFLLLIIDSWIFEQGFNTKFDDLRPPEILGLILSTGITIIVALEKLQKYWTNMVVILIAALTSAMSYSYYTTDDPYWSLGYLALMIVAPAIYIVNNSWYVTSITIPWLGWLMPWAVLQPAGQGFDIKPALFTSIFATMLSVAVHSLLKSNENEHAKGTEMLQHKAYYDDLTGILNRAGLYETLKRMPSMPVGVLFIDVNGLKGINDTYGHSVGDVALVQVTLALRSSIRAGEDILGRWGGDEFIVITQNVNVSSEEFKKRVGEHLKLKHDGVSVPISIAVGKSSGTVPDDLENLIDQADANMYRAKTNMLQN